jgi:hypothetical protein
MISGAAGWVGEPGRAWAPNENIEATTEQAKIEAIFDIEMFSPHDDLKDDNATPAILSMT